MALKSDGTISVWGAHSMRQSEIPAGLGTVVAIAAGGPYCLAIQSSSSLTQTNAQHLAAIELSDSAAKRWNYDNKPHEEFWPNLSVNLAEPWFAPGCSAAVCYVSQTQAIEP